MYKFLADLVAGIHLAYVSFVVLGQAAILLGWLRSWSWVRNPWFRWIHLVMMCIVAGEAILQIDCPLTVWENRLREQTWNQQTLPGAGAEVLGLLAGPLGDGPYLGPVLLHNLQPPPHAETFVGQLLDSLMFPPLPSWIFPFLHMGFAILVIATFILVPPVRSNRERIWNP